MMKGDPHSDLNQMPDPAATRTRRLGEARIPSPLLLKAGRRFVPDDSRVIVPHMGEDLDVILARGDAVPTFETSGARDKIYFDPETLKCGIVTCGGLCPGLNNVVRALVRTLSHSYGVTDVTGFRYGYQGLSREPLAEPVALDFDGVEDIHRFGGTMLGSCRGGPPVPEIVDTLVRRGIRLLFTVGGDGTLRGADAIAREILDRGLDIAVVGIPKTIDNDLLWVERSFGFTTAVNEAASAIIGAHEEARGAWNGIGLVKLMGRESGFIATHATLSNQEVNFCLIPEVPFDLDGPDGFFAALEARLERKRHAVVVVAEGAGQQLFDHSGSDAGATDASGNRRLDEIGLLLKHRISEHLDRRGIVHTLKYIDPSYTLRSLPAGTLDSELCSSFAQYAVHAGMAGKTAVYIGYHNATFVDVPIALGVASRKHVNPDSDKWRRVLEGTRQPASMKNLTISTSSQ